METKDPKQKIEELKKIKDNQIKLIEQRIYAQRQDVLVSKMTHLRMLPVILICFILAFVAVVKFNIEGNVIVNTLIISVILIVIAYGAFNRFRGKYINREADRIIRKKIKSEEILRKYSTEDELQRLNVLDAQIRELNEKLENESSINTNSSEYNLKLPKIDEKE